MSMRALRTYLVLGFLLFLSGYAVRSILSQSRWSRLFAAAGHVRAGMSKQQVLSIMGAPDLRAYPDYHPPEGRDVFWYRPFDWCFTRPKPEIIIEFVSENAQRVVILPDADIRFASDDWRTSPSDRRGCMAMDLVRRINLLTMTRKEVVAVLGPPDRIETSNVEMFIYNIGMLHTVDMDEDLLVIEFSPLGGVRSAKLHY